MPGAPQAGSAAGGADGGGKSSAGDTATGGSGKAGSSSGADVDLDDFFADYVGATCKLLARCQPLLTSFLTPAQCTEFFQSTFDEGVRSSLDRAISEGTVVYDPARAAECLSQLSKAGCDGSAYPACSQSFVGQQKLGDSCSLSAECVDQQCGGDGTCPGHCAAPHKLGEPCSDVGCTSGLSCATASDGEKRCLQTALLGQTCSQTVHCGGYTFCSGLDPKDVNDTGTCLERSALQTAKLGEECDSFGEPQCEGDLVCTTALQGTVVVGQCQPKAKSGGACTYAFPDACPNGEHCHITSAAGVKPAAGDCRPNPKLGEECLYGTANAAPCAVVGQYCDPDSKLCAKTATLGAACSRGAECASQVCTAGKCTGDMQCGSPM